jgi:subtilase family serine protease
MKAFNTEALKLAAMGVTILVSSGDDGAVADYDYCKYDSSSGAYGDGWKVRSICMFFVD